jgi:galactokinase/mevalonate kinase-like predicted kinase
MNNSLIPWDYLIVTASNEAQARAYESQLNARQELGFLPNVRNVLVVADPEGRRVGSGGSTLCCLIEVVNRELAAKPGTVDLARCEAILRELRILIIHAGGDSRRLPAYGPCGKIFIPLSDDCDSALGTALFDRVAPLFMALPMGMPGAGQIVVTAGDALILFDPEKVVFNRPGLTAVTCPATPDAASKHGVFCPLPDGRVRLYLQKPRPEEQRRLGAVNRHGQSFLDIGIMSFDARFAIALCHAFGVEVGAAGMMEWAPEGRQEMMALGIDFYREVCCSLGTEATAAHYQAQSVNSGSKWSGAALERVFKAMTGNPFHLSIVPRARFLHFGTTRQLITSGIELRLQDRAGASPSAALSINNQVLPSGGIVGAGGWVEGCRIAAPLRLTGGNVVIGLDIDEPLSLPENGCIDVLRGTSRKGEDVWFIRYHGIGDTFKDAAVKGGTFCNLPILEWLRLAGIPPEAVWDSSIPAAQRTLWEARVFPAESQSGNYRRWLWMLQPGAASTEQKQAFLSADRYSAAEIAVAANQDDFFARRQQTRAETLVSDYQNLFRPESAFSARELAWQLTRTHNRAAAVAGLFQTMRSLTGMDGTVSLENFQYCRVLHSFGTALGTLAPEPESTLGRAIPGFSSALPADLRDWLRERGFDVEEAMPVARVAALAHELAFAEMNRTILHSSLNEVQPPRNALRCHETVWGRAPARLELGGAWTDTPPYTLEFGGEVLNMAINLNGQPPIHCYGRVIDAPVIRLFSIDTGLHVEIRDLDSLLAFRDPHDPFGLVKASIAIAGFSPSICPAQQGKSLEQMLREFGGGIELTTLNSLPRGSGLGASRVLGAVVLAVLQRMLGRLLTDRELFHQALRLEQALTAGGGWQDSVGGAMPGTKITHTEPGLIPDPRIHCVPSDLLNPRDNGGSTLLYDTGLTSPAGNIFQQVAGGCMDRDRRILEALRGLREVARQTADAMALKNLAEFGRLAILHRRLTQILCPDAGHPQVDRLLERVRPHVYGARLIGAGHGGFMLMICKSPEDAARVRADLEASPLNDCARFFDFEVNNEGLKVTSC